MQALVRSGVVEGVRGLSTALALLASPRCPDCKPALYCGEQQRCPDCVCNGQKRDCTETAVFTFWDKVSTFFAGLLFGLVLALLGALYLSSARRRPSLPIVAQPEEPVAETTDLTQAEQARHQLQTIALRRRNGSIPSR